MISLTALANGWNAFFHAREPPTTVALFRIVLGTVLMANAGLLRNDARLLFGPAGLLSDEQHRRTVGASQFTLLRYLPPTDGWLYACLALHAIAALSLMIGFLTRVSALVAFITLVSIQNRNPLVTYGGDMVLRLMTFLLIFSRAGDALSVDHLLAGAGAANGPAPSAWCVRVMQLQVSIIYFKAFLAKFEGRTWWHGTATYYATEVRDFRRRRLPAHGRHAMACRATTWATLLVEFAFGPLIWIRELRPLVLAAGVALHLSMEVFLNLHLFGATMMACLTLFLDPFALERVLSAAGLA